MSDVVLVLQIIVGVALVAMILVQSKGTGLGRAWGGSGGTSFTRRGLERLLYRGTFVASFIFVFLSIAQIFV